MKKLKDEFAKRDSKRKPVRPSTKKKKRLQPEKRKNKKIVYYQMEEE